MRFAAVVLMALIATGGLPELAPAHGCRVVQFGCDGTPAWPRGYLRQGLRSDRLRGPAVAPSTKLVVGSVEDRGAQHLLANAAGVLHVTRKCSRVCDFW